jgi:hypothetical protein
MEREWQWTFVVGRSRALQIDRCERCKWSTAKPTSWIFFSLWSRLETTNPDCSPSLPGSLPRSLYPAALAGAATGITEACHSNLFDFWARGLKWPIFLRCTTREVAGHPYREKTKGSHQKSLYLLN